MSAKSRESMHLRHIDFVLQQPQLLLRSTSISTSTFCFYNGLPGANISMIRKILTEAAEDSGKIQSFSGHGYSTVYAVVFALCHIQSPRNPKTPNVSRFESGSCLGGFL
jgi:hypothetical protein